MNTTALALALVQAPTPTERVPFEVADVDAGGSCALAPPFLCVATTFLAICACLPLLSELTGDDAECG